MWWVVIPVLLAACGGYPKGEAPPEGPPMVVCGKILRDCYALWRRCDAERYPPCESRCATEYVYEDEVRACVDACYPCTRDRIACGTRPACDDAQEQCEDGAHALVVSHDVPSPPELLCLSICDPAVGAPADGCDARAGEVCSEVVRLADASRLRDGGVVFACQ
jgi:hypothetical protein